MRKFWLGRTEKCAQRPSIGKALGRQPARLHTARERLGQVAWLILAKPSDYHLRSRGQDGVEDRHSA
jgi:hypothetical protein